jgi:hypothetical protein
MSRAQHRSLFSALLALQVACGATTKHAPDDGTSGQGAVSMGGFSGSSAAGARSGNGGVGGAGGRGNGGAAAAGEPSSGGSGHGGSGGEPSGTDCETEYSGPMGGPRLEGPMPTGGCDLIADELILARYKDFDARVPEGSYYEPTAPIAFWSSLPCSMTPTETIRRAELEQLGTLEDEFQTEWFFEAAYCQNGLRRVYRNLRCDYFDGTKLRSPSDEELAFLGSLLWWSTHYNTEGSALLGYSIMVGDATDWVQLCTIATVHGDFGLCDEITLQSTTHRLTYPGTVQLGEPTTVRTLKGDCH